MAKARIITIGSNSYELRPAKSRSHYLGANNTGGTPYAFPAKKADGAWFVVSRINGKILGVVEEHYEEWGFQKIARDGLPKIADRALAANGQLKAGEIYYELDRRIHAGATMTDAIANGLGIRS